MSDQDGTEDPTAEGSTPRAHPEEPAEGADVGEHDSEEPRVPRRHSQEPAEGAEEPGSPT